MRREIQPDRGFRWISGVNPTYKSNLSVDMNDSTQTWYSLTPSGAVTLGNLTPVGQNSGQVGCRWPPNGHQLAACINLPARCQLWGPFWLHRRELYVPLPLPVYCLESDLDPETQLPDKIFRMHWQQGYWQLRPEHRHQPIETIGGRYLIEGSALAAFWSDGEQSPPHLQPFPWETLTLSRNRREQFQVAEEGGFFAEMTTLMHPGWSIALLGFGEWEPPAWGQLGAGGTPVAIAPTRVRDSWLHRECPQASGGILLTGALWQQEGQTVSVPVPPVPMRGYAADLGIPWQSWKTVRDRRDRTQTVKVLTPGEWLTPAGAVYLWDGEPPMRRSQPLRDRYNRHVLGYGHLWLFE